ncbi:MAG: hypothetical protein ACLQLG_01965 [Thermoguttaceae bacterium]
MTLTLLPSLAFCQPMVAPEMIVDLGYITPDTVAAVVAYPRYVLSHPAMEMLPVEVITALGERDFGIDPIQVEQLLAISEPPQSGPPGGLVVLRLAAPVAEDKLHAPAWDHTVEAQFGGKTYRRGAGMTDVSIFRADDHTVLIGTDPLLRKALNNHSSPQDGAMSKLLRRVKSPPNVMAIVLMEPLRPLMAMPMAMVKWPPQLADVPKVPDLVTSVGLKVNLTSGPSVLLAIRANDEASAQELEKTIDKLLAAAREQMAAQTARGFRSSDPVDQASAKYGQRVTERMLQWARPVRKGNSLILTADLGKNPQVMLAAVLAPVAVAFWRMAVRQQEIHAQMRVLQADELQAEPEPAQPSRPQAPPKR